MKEFELSRIDPYSAGKISAVFYALMGAFMVPMYAPFLAIFLFLDVNAAAIVGGIVAIVTLAVVGIISTAVLGFLMGVFMAYLYNYLASKIGGVKMEFEEV